MKNIAIFGGRGATLKNLVCVDGISANGLKSEPRHKACSRSIFQWLLALSLLPIFICAAIASPADDLKTTVANLQVAVQALTADDHAAYAKLQSIIAATNQGQSVLVVAGVTTAKTGPVSVPLTIVPGQLLPASLQVDVLLPTGVTFVSAVAGQSTTDAGKLAQAAPITGGVRVIVFGLNQTPLAQGPIVTLNLTVGSSVAKGIYPISMVNPVASNGAGNSIPVCVTSGILGVN